MEGVSLRTTFAGKKLERSKPLFWEHNGNRAIRKGDWKLVSKYDDEAKKYMPWELYNLKHDRSELNNRISENPELKNQMVLEYEQWANRVGVIKPR